jgi:hypothetical protein
MPESLISEVVMSGAHTGPLLVARTVHGGAGFRIILIRRGVDACLRCLELHRESSHPDWIDVPESPYADIFDEGCAAASRPGSGLASQVAALAAADVAIAVLEGRDVHANHWLHIREPISDADSRLDVRGVHEFVFRPHADCEWCGT